MGISGSGRHRRPTRADQAVATVSVAGVGLALPLLTAAGAHAAPVNPTTPSPSWDAVAQCASGGDWQANQGNGLYGGLQLSERTWIKYGGDQYAAEPDHATKDQQIAVAQQLLDDKGPSVWPSCAAQFGPAAVPAAPATASPAASAPSTTPTATPSTASNAPVPATPAPANDASAAPVAPVTSAAPTVPSVPPATADTPVAAAPAVPSTPSTPTHSPVLLAPTPATSAPATPVAPTASTGSGDYTVQPGDTLYGIAQSHGLPNWMPLYQDNRGTVGGDPNLILPGQTLHLG